MKKLLIVGIIVSLIAAAFIACDENTTEPVVDPQPGTVTFNLTAPIFGDVAGNVVAVSLWAAWNDTIPLLVTDGTFSGNVTTLQIPNVAPGTYIALAAVDGTGDGFPAGEPFGDLDQIWIGLDFVVDGNQAINVSQYAWQELEASWLLVGIKGIPAGHDGEVFGAILCPDSTNLLENVEPEIYYAGVGLVYNNSAALVLNVDSDSVISELPAGNYDLWMIADVDGNIADWYDTTGGGENPLSNGDLLASHDFVFDPMNDLDYFQLITATGFTELVTYSLTFNITAPTGETVEGHDVIAGIWGGSLDQDPVGFDSTTISAGTATLQIPIVSGAEYQVAVFLDADGNGFDLGGQNGPPDYGDFVWAALNVSSTAADLVINVGADTWQRSHSITVAVENVPAGHDGDVFSVGLIEAGTNPLDPYSDFTVMAGVGLAYNSSAIITLWPMTGTSPDSAWTLPYGEYEIWGLVDVDGALSDYDAINDSTAFSPVTDGDYYFSHNYVHTAEQSYDNFIQFSTDFFPAVGISGTISCPPWTDAGGGIYVYLFEENPILSDSANTYSFSALTQPGAYWIPCLPGDSVVVVGFWDVDSSGEWDGPTHAVDYIGGYGPAIDSLSYVTCLPSGVGNIDFIITDMYDSTLYGPQ